MKMPGKTTTETTDVFTLLTEQIFTLACCFLPSVKGLHQASFRPVP